MCTCKHVCLFHRFSVGLCQRHWCSPVEARQRRQHALSTCLTSFLIVLMSVVSMLTLEAERHSNHPTVRLQIFDWRYSASCLCSYYAHDTWFTLFIPLSLQWLKEEFLPYLEGWKKSVQERKGFSDGEKKKMQLSDETLLGLEMTGIYLRVWFYVGMGTDIRSNMFWGWKCMVPRDIAAEIYWGYIGLSWHYCMCVVSLLVRSFLELVPYLFTIPGVKAFLSEKLCQDPLEKFFGCQRQRGRVNENPNCQDFCKNTQALRVVNSFVGPVKSNCRGNKTEAKINTDKENKPLPKQRYLRKV